MVVMVNNAHLFNPHNPPVHPADDRVRVSEIQKIRGQPHPYAQQVQFPQARE